MEESIESVAAEVARGMRDTTAEIKALRKQVERLTADLAKLEARNVNALNRAARKGHERGQR